MGIIKNILFIALFIFVTKAHSQISNVRRDIVKYDYATYQGEPIKTGWLFSQEAYEKLYKSYNAADSLIKQFEQFNMLFNKFDSLMTKLPEQYESRLADKDKVILNQQKDIGELNLLIKQSDQNVKDIMKQFITIGNVKIHKGTAIKIGVPLVVAGYLIGRF